LTRRQATRRGRRPRPTVSWPGRLKGPLIVAVPVVVTGLVLAVIAVNQHTPRSASTTTTTGRPNQVQTWSTAITGDVSPMASDLVGLLQTTGEWQTGGASSAAVRTDLETGFPSAQAALQSLQRQAPLRAVPDALPRYEQAVELYIEAFQVEHAATLLPAGPLQQQLQKSFARVREIGDRVYDQASSLLSPYLPTPAADPDVQVIPAPTVPDWGSIGLAAGPPLDSAPASAANPAAGNGSPRPQEAVSKWVKAVSAAGIPSTSAEAQAVTTGTVVGARAIADQLQSALQRLNDGPDPAHLSAISVEVRLGLLVDAEAARAAEAAGLVTATPAAAEELRAVATSLALIGQQLWDPQLLGARASPIAGDPTSLALDTAL